MKLRIDIFKRIQAPLMVIMATVLLMSGCTGEGTSDSGELAPSNPEAGSTSLAIETVEAYPDAPIEYVVPYDAGGGTDTAARMLQPYLAKELDQQVDAVIRSGGAGATGVLHLLGEPADGYTLLAGENGIMTTGPLANPDTPYDPAEDLLGVASFTADPWVLMVNADTGITSMEEFVERSETDPGSIGFAITAVLSADHYAFLLLQRALDYPAFRTIAYGGGGPKSLAVLGGEAEAMMEIAADAQAGIDDGLVVPIMVMSDERIEALPDVPTALELGYQDLLADTWQGVMVHRETPDEIVEILEAAIENSFENPEFQKQMTDLGAELRFRGSDEFEEVMASERVEATSIIEQINVESIEEREAQEE